MGASGRFKRVFAKKTIAKLFFSSLTTQEVQSLLRRHGLGVPRGGSRPDRAPFAPAAPPRRGAEAQRPRLPLSSEFVRRFPGRSAIIEYESTSDDEEEVPMEPPRTVTSAPPAGSSASLLDELFNLGGVEAAVTASAPSVPPSSGASAGAARFPLPELSVLPGQSVEEAKKFYMDLYNDMVANKLADRIDCLEHSRRFWELHTNTILVGSRVSAMQRSLQAMTIGMQNLEDLLDATQASNREVLERERSALEARQAQTELVTRRLQTGAAVVGASLLAAAVLSLAFRWMSRR